jgi:hypothetical protein
VLTCVRADRRRSGYVYVGFIREGLWRSTDHGAHGDKLYPRDGSLFNASAIDIGGKTGDEIVIACEPLFWSDAPSQVLVSHDCGGSFRDISDQSLGAVRWKGIAFDTASGDIHGITCGNGVFAARRE